MKKKKIIIIDETRSIVFDADVIIHFLNGDKLLDLLHIFPNEAIIIDKVYGELAKNKKTKTSLDNLINLKLLNKVAFPGNLEIIKEYAHLRSPLMNKGIGESACLAYCKHTKDTIASSNLKDIREYCKLHKIQNLTTIDFIINAYKNGIWKISELKKFIDKLVANNHRVPFNSFKDFMKKFGSELS